MKERLQLPLDLVDIVFVGWAIGLVYLNQQGGRYGGGIALLLLWVVVLSAQTRAPYMRPLARCLSVVLLSLATVNSLGTFAKSGQLGMWHYGLCVASLLLAWIAFNVLSRRFLVGSIKEMWGIRKGEAEQADIAEMRARVFEQLVAYPVVGAILAVITSVVVWDPVLRDMGTPVLLAAIWLPPFVLNAAVLYRIDRRIGSALNRKLQIGANLPRIGPIEIGMLVASGLGFAIETITRDMVALWGLISSLLLLVALGYARIRQITCSLAFDEVIERRIRRRSPIVSAARELIILFSLVKYYVILLKFVAFVFFRNR